MMLHQDLPRTPELPSKYVRVQRSAAERRANRIEGMRRRRMLNQYENVEAQVAAVARRQRKEKEETGVGPFEDGVIVQRTNIVRTEVRARVLPFRIRDQERTR